MALHKLLSNLIPSLYKQVINPAGEKGIYECQGGAADRDWLSAANNAIARFEQSARDKGIDVTSNPEYQKALDFRDQVQNCMPSNVIDTITSYQGEPNVGLYIGIGVAIAVGIGGLMYMKSRKKKSSAQ